MKFGTITTGIKASLEQKLDRIKGWGMEAWQPAFQEVDQKDPQRLKDLVAERGLVMSALGAGVPMANPAMLQKNIEDWRQRVLASASLGIKPLFSRTFKQPDGVSDDETWKACAQIGREMVRIAEDHGCCYALEVDSGNFVHSLDGALRLLELIGDDRTRINFDPCNFYVGGGDDPLKVIDTLYARFVHGHIKDGVRPAGGKPHEVAVGTGDLDYAKIFGELHRRGFQGAMVLEHMKDFEEIEKGWEHVKKVRARLGI